MTQSSSLGSIAAYAISCFFIAVSIFSAMFALVTAILLGASYDPNAILLIQSCCIIVTSSGYTAALWGYISWQLATGALR